MSITSSTLNELRRAALRGGVVNLSGLNSDTMFVDGQPLEERIAIQRALEQGGYPLVLWADGTGLCSADRKQTARALTEVSRLAGSVDGRPWHETLRVLGAQSQSAVAIVVDDPTHLLADAESGTAAIPNLLSLAANRGDAPGSPKNALVLIERAGSMLPAALTNIAGSSRVARRAPNLDERKATIALLKGSFHGAKRLDAESLGLACELLARRTSGMDVNDIVGLRNASLKDSIPITATEKLVGVSRVRGRDRLRERVVKDAAMIHAELCSEVVCQDEAIERMSSGLVRTCKRDNPIRTMGDSSGAPLAMAMLVGPPGVGKSQYAKALARALYGSEGNLISIACASAKGEDGVRQLIGAGAGYRGHGTLTPQMQSLLQGSDRVLLLDEFEKGGPEFAAILIDALQEGRIARLDGIEISLAETTVILTANSGSDAVAAELRAGTITNGAEVRNRFVTAAWDQLNQNVGAAAAPLWSRLKNDIYGFRFLEHDDLPALLTKFSGNVSATQLNDFGLRVGVDVEAFTDRIRPQLGEIGEWDGRDVYRLMRSEVSDALDAAYGDTPRDIESLVPAPIL